MNTERHVQSNDVALTLAPRVVGSTSLSLYQEDVTIAPRMLTVTILTIATLTYAPSLSTTWPVKRIGHVIHACTQFNSFKWQTKVTRSTNLHERTVATNLFDKESCTHRHGCRPKW